MSQLSKINKLLKVNEKQNPDEAERNIKSHHKDLMKHLDRLDKALKGVSDTDLDSFALSGVRGGIDYALQQIIISLRELEDAGLSDKEREDKKAARLFQRWK